VATVFCDRVADSLAVTGSGTSATQSAKPSVRDTAWRDRGNLTVTRRSFENATMRVVTPQPHLAADFWWLEYTRKMQDGNKLFASNFGEIAR
jgi:hypothetical protein